LKNRKRKKDKNTRIEDIKLQTEKPGELIYALSTKGAKIFVTQNQVLSPCLEEEKRRG